MVDAPRITLDITRPAATWPVRLRQGIAFMLYVPLFAGGALVMLLVATCTLFRARRLYAECLARNLTRVALWLHGVGCRPCDSSDGVVIVRTLGYLTSLGD